MIPKTVAALDFGSPPDVAYADVYDFQVTAKWAFDGKLEDISDVIEPMKDEFAPNTMSTTYLWNDVDAEARLLRLPAQAADHAHPVLEGHAGSGGLHRKRYPQRMGCLLGFWCSKVQAGVRKATGERIFGIGAPMGVESSDAYYSFLTFMDAYNVKLVDDEGKLLVDDPAVKEGLVRALIDSYIMPYQNGCAPQSATTWKDPDNNVAFHNRTTVLTHNATISIAAKWLDDLKNADADRRRSATRPRNYNELIATAGFPNKPDGTPMHYRAAVKTGVIFKEPRTRLGQGVRRLPAAGRESHALCRRLARPLVPGDQ